MDLCPVVLSYDVALRPSFVLASRTLNQTSTLRGLVSLQCPQPLSEHPLGKMSCRRNIQLTKTMTLTPAYGRDYSSKAAVLADFNNERDFMTNTFDEPSRLINRQQIRAGTQVTFRYAKLRKTFSVTK